MKTCQSVTSAIPTRPTRVVLNCGPLHVSDLYNTHLRPVTVFTPYAEHRSRAKATARQGTQFSDAG